MPYTPTGDTSSLVVSLGYAFEASFTGGTSTINTVGFGVSAADIGRVVMVLSGDPNIDPGFTVTWSTVATVPSSSQFTIGATLPGSSIAVVNVVLYRPLPTGNAGIPNSVKSGSIEVDLSLTSFQTAKFEIISTDGSLIPQPFMPVLITDTEVGVEYFGGEIRDNQINNEPGTTIVYSNIQAVGWEVIAKRLGSGVADAQIDQNTTFGVNNPAVGTFVALRADQIADYFVTGSGYMRNDGVTGNYDTTGPTLPVFQAIAAKLSDMLDQLCRAATTPGKQFNWFFSPRKVLNIVTLNTTAAPFNIKDSDGSAGNALAPLQNTLSNQNYFNRATATVDSITQQFVGDGSSRAFTLTTAVPATALGLVSIVLNGQSQTVGQLGVDKKKNWYYSTGSPTITQDASGTTLSTTDVLSVSFPVWSEIFIDDLPAQSSMAALQSGSGTWEQKIDLQAVSTVVDAQSFTQAMLDEAKNVAQQLQISTYRPGLNIGQTIAIQLASVGVPTITSFMIDTLTITGTPDNRKLYAFTASLDAPYLGGWVRKLKRGIGTAAGVHGHPLAVPGSASAQLVASGGTSGKGGAGGGQTVVCEVPAGTIDGVNTVFTTSQPMNTSPAPILMLNGIVQDPLNSPTDYTFSGKTITYATAPAVSGSPPLTDKHVIWYWTGDGSGKQARLFSGGTNAVDYGTGAAFRLIADMAAGLWVKLSSASAAGDFLCVSGRFTNVSAVTTVYFNIRVSLAGASGAWKIDYFHDTAAGVLQYIQFNCSIPNNSWRYIGISRDHTAKTVTLYIGDGTSLVTFGTASYGSNPNAGITNSHMDVGREDNLSSATSATIEEHYVWNRKLTATEHQQAMQGAPPSSGLILSCLMGSTPEVDLSPTGASGTVTGTTLVAGH